MKNEELIASQASHAEKHTEEVNHKNPKQRANMWAFIIPLIALIVFTLLNDIDLLRGIIATLMLTVPIMIGLKLINMYVALDALLEGFKIMIPPLMIVVAAFMFKTINDQIGFPQFIMESVKPFMSPTLFPVIVFISMAFMSFATASNWGIFAIAIPIVMPLGIALEVPLSLTIGALLSAASFGSHACFYTDATVLSAQSCGISPMKHALTQFPYALIAAGAAAIFYIAYAYVVV
mgnify:FL=1